MPREPRRRRRGRLWEKTWADHAQLRTEVTVVVPFQDADPSGFAWHGNYFRYYDTARVALLAALDSGYLQMGRDGQIWPIIDTRVRYIKSTSFDAVLQVSAQVVEWEYALRIYYQIHDDQGTLINEAYTVQVAVDIESHTLMFGVPPSLRSRIEARLADDG